VKPIIACAIAAASFGLARVARTKATATATQVSYEAPYAPSPGAGPFLSLGFREAMADILFVRLRVYFGGSTDSARGVAELAEAIAATDPQFHRIYEYGAHAMLLGRNANQSVLMRAIELLEAGMRQFPDDWRLPLLAGQIYTQDLVTDDPAKRRDWDERGTLLVESASRKPGAPPNAGEWVAVMRTKLGERERAVSGLRELILMTDDPKARKNLIDRLAKLEEADADVVAAELFTARRQFETRWRAERPGLPPTFFVLLGPRLSAGFDIAVLATGGHELATMPIERLEPLYDEAEQQTP
jgi:hypothetical protein